MLTIISDNCWGIGVYNTNEWQYNSPMLNWLVECDPYIRFVEGFDRYMAMELHEIRQEIKIDFPHYIMPFEQIVDLWNRRKARMDMSNLLFKFSYMRNDGADVGNYVKRFHAIPYKTISFTPTKYEYANNYQITQEHMRDAYVSGKEYGSYGIEL